MYDLEPDTMPPVPPVAVTTMLDARDIVTLSKLMFELRDITQSRGTFTSASEFLRRFGAETEGPRLVPADALDR